MTPYCGQQVHEALLDPLELLVQVRRRLPQPLDALALEARVVGHDLARARANLDHCLGERRSRILQPLRDPLMMLKSAAPPLNMRAELHRHLLPRPAPRPSWDRKAHGLEIEKRERRPELGQRLRERKSVV